MQKEHFLTQRRSKQQPRGDGPFQVLEKINDNAYKLDLSGEDSVSATFNVTNLSPFDTGDDSWTNTFEETGNDMEHQDALYILMGPTTRARAKRMKEAMNGLVAKIFDDHSTFLEALESEKINQGFVHCVQGVEIETLLETGKHHGAQN